MVKLINPQDNKLNKEQTASITKGAKWVKDWYQQRKESNNFTELPEKPEFEEVMNRAENLQILVTDNADDIYTALEKALERGDVHFQDDILLRTGGYDMALQIFKEANQLKREQRKDMVIGGLSAPKCIAEPVIVLNQKVIKNFKPQEIESVVIHETTHAVEAQTSELMLKLIHEERGSSNDEYVDNPREMYARLMQLRHHFNLSPDKECTKEDIARMREECTKRMDEFVKNNGDDTEIPEYIDFMMFDRYPDIEIQELLNYTSDNIRPEQKKSDINRPLLAGDMLRDKALADAKGRAVGYLETTSSKQAVVTSEKSNKETPSTELDMRVISHLADKQYS